MDSKGKKDSDDSLIHGWSEWWKELEDLEKLGMIVAALVVFIFVLGAASVSSTHSDTTSGPVYSQGTPDTTDNTTETNTTTTTSSSGSSGEYDQGYDDGYFYGVQDAYQGLDSYPSTTAGPSDSYRTGYKAGYEQGYSDIKNGNPLQTPKVPGTAITDPRTGEKIENT